MKYVCETIVEGFTRLTCATAMVHPDVKCTQYVALLHNERSLIAS